MSWNLPPGVTSNDIERAAGAFDESCECGEPGAWPYPIGGAWALACNTCRVLAEQSPDGPKASDWERWALEADR